MRQESKRHVLEKQTPVLGLQKGNGTFFPVELFRLSDPVLSTLEFLGSLGVRTGVAGMKQEAGQPSAGESPGPAGSHCHQELLRPSEGSLESKHLGKAVGKCVLHQGRHKQSLLKRLLRDIPNCQQAS